MRSTALGPGTYLFLGGPDGGSRCIPKRRSTQAMWKIQNHMLPLARSLKAVFLTRVPQEFQIIYLGAATGGWKHFWSPCSRLFVKGCAYGPPASQNSKGALTVFLAGMKGMFRFQPLCTGNPIIKYNNTSLRKTVSHQYQFPLFKKIHNFFTFDF